MTQDLPVMPHPVIPHHNVPKMQKLEMPQPHCCAEYCHMLKSKYPDHTQCLQYCQCTMPIHKIDHLVAQNLHCSIYR